MSSSAAEVVQARIDKLRRQEQQHQEIIDSSAAAIKSIREKVALLHSVLADIGDATEVSEDEPAEGGADSSGEAVGLRPADAIKALLRKHPLGLPQREIVGYLESRIASQSGDRRRLLYNSIFNLRKRGVIRDSQTSTGDTVVVLTQA